jgi:hypothetical protein
MADVFPHGCYLAQDSISGAQDCDDSLDARVVVDKLTGKRVFSCQVTDMHPELKGQPRQTEIKVVADRMPVLPPPANGSPLTAIQFEGLTAAGPPSIDHGRAAYSSLRATGIRLATPVTPAKQ